jgi:hypothetical protein
MSHLAVSDSTVDWREQSGPCPGHTFKKTAAINAIVAKVPDNAFCHWLTFRLNGRSDFKNPLRHLAYFGRNSSIKERLVRKANQTGAASPTREMPRWTR